MKRKNPELSTLSIFGIAAAFAIAGSVFYALVKPIAPATRIALAHAAINELAATTPQNGTVDWN